MAKTDTVSNSQPGGDVLKFETPKDKTEDRVVLFTIDDKEFDVPKKPGMKVIMRYLNVSRKTGSDLFAAQKLVEDMLGEEKWEEFLAWDGLTDEIVSTVISKCITIATESVEEEAKN